MTFHMPRIGRTIKIDSRVLEAIDRLAGKADTSVNNYIENLLLSHAKILGEMPMDSEILPDNRGGKRQGSGRKKKDEPD
jgi:hypothetical protein